MTSSNITNTAKTFTKKFSNYSLAVVSAFVATSVLIHSNAYAQEDFSSVYQLFNESVENQHTGEAVKYAKRALALGAVKFGVESENTVNLKYNLALAYVADKQAEPAGELLEEIKQDFRRLFGEYSAKHFASVLEQLIRRTLMNLHHEPR